MFRSTGNRTLRPTRLGWLGVVLAATISIVPTPGRAGVVPGTADPSADPQCLVPGMDDHCEQWVTEYGKNRDRIAAGAVSNSGDMAFALGERTDWPRTILKELQTVAYDVKTGAVRWVAHEAGPTEEWHAIPRAIVVGADDRTVYVVGTVVLEMPAQQDILVVAYDAATGNRLWRSVYDGPMKTNDDAWAAAVSPVDDRLYVAGAAQVSSHPTSMGGFSPVYMLRGMHLTISGDVDFALLSYDGRSGELLDETTSGGEPFVVDGETRGSWDVPTDIVVSPDGRRVAVAGVSSGRSTFADGRPRATVVAWEAEHDASGWRRLWSRDLPGVPLGFGQTGNGSTYYIAGAYSEKGTTDAPYGVAALDGADGSLRWETPFDLGRRNARSEYPRALIVDEQRATLYLPGMSRYSTSSTGTAGVLALQTSDGAVRWKVLLSDLRTTTTRVFDYDGDQMPIAAVDPASGHVHVASWREGKVATLSLDRATGSTRWIAIYGIPVTVPVYEQTWAFPTDIEVAAGTTTVFATSIRNAPPGELTGPRNNFLTLGYRV